MCFNPSLTCVIPRSKNLSISPILGTVSEKLPLTQCLYSQDRKSLPSKEETLCILIPRMGSTETQDIISIFSRKWFYSHLLQSAWYDQENRRSNTSELSRKWNRYGKTAWLFTLSKGNSSLTSQAPAGAKYCPQVKNPISNSLNYANNTVPGEVIKSATHRRGDSH